MVKCQKMEEDNKENEKEESNELNTQIQMNSDISIMLTEKKEELKREEAKKIEKRKEMEEKIEMSKLFTEDYMKLIDKLEDSIKRLKPGESRLYEYGDRLIQCWKCQQLNLVKEHWEVIECSNCRHYCKLNAIIDPLRTKTSNVHNSSSSPDPLSLNTRVPCIFTVIACPFCRAQNKQLASEDELKCFVCKKVCNVIKPEKKPKEQDCYSFDPNNRYYKFNYRKNLIYPPINSYGISDLFFPDPFMYNTPVNPMVNYNVPYEKLQAIHGQRRVIRENDKKGIEFQYGNKEKKYLIAKLKDIDYKVTSAIEGSKYERKLRESQDLAQSQNYNTSKINSYKNTFFMKK